MDIEKNIKTFIEGEGKNKGRQASERYASFDYCFNYFQSFRDNGSQEAIAHIDHLQTSCLHLSFYLASWGMFRGSSFLLERSSKFFEPLIRAIAKHDVRIWEIDVNDYGNPQDRLTLLKCKDAIIEALGANNNPSDTLVTKIMLGVFGNVPAYDAYFKKGFNLKYFDDMSLQSIHDFYSQNQVIIDSYRIRTIDFNTGQETDRVYTKAKVIDMVGFIEGQS